MISNDLHLIRHARSNEANAYLDVMAHPFFATFFSSYHHHFMASEHMTYLCANRARKECMRGNKLKCIDLVEESSQMVQQTNKQMQNDSKTTCLRRQHQNHLS